MDDVDVAEARIAEDRPPVADDRSSVIESRLDALADAIAALRRSLPTADVTSRLTSQVDALPDTLAARLGVDASNAALGLRIGGLASAIEQSKLAAQAAAEHTKVASESPTWLPRLTSLETTTLAAQVAAEEIRAAVEDPPWVAHLLARIDAVQASVTATEAAQEEHHRAVAEQLHAIQSRLDVPQDERLANEVHTLAEGVAQVVQASSVDRAAHDATLHELRSQVAALGEVPARLSAVAVTLDRIATMPDPSSEIAGTAKRLLAALERLPAGLAAASITAAFERMEQRDRSLAGRLDRLQEISSVATTAPPSPAEDPVAPALDGLAAATDDLAALLADTTAHVDERFDEIQRRLDAVQHAAAAAGSTRAENAATLALLRAERAIVQAALDDERASTD